MILHARLWLAWIDLHSLQVLSVCVAWLASTAMGVPVTRRKKCAFPIREAKRPQEIGRIFLERGTHPSLRLAFGLPKML